MKKTHPTRRFATFASLGLSALLVLACSDDSDLEDMGDSIEDGVEDVGDSIEDGVEEIGDEIEDATDG